MFDLAKRNGIKIPYSNVNEVKSAYNFSNLETFLNIYYEGSKVLIKEQDFFDLTWSYAIKCREDNIVHTEIFFDPQAHLSRGVKFETVINGINKALLKANKEFRLTYKIIMCFLRHLDEKSAFEVLDQAMKNDPAFMNERINAKADWAAKKGLNFGKAKIKQMVHGMISGKAAALAGTILGGMAGGALGASAGGMAGKYLGTKVLQAALKSPKLFCIKPIV